MCYAIKNKKAYVLAYRSFLDILDKRLLLKDTEMIIKEKKSRRRMFIWSIPKTLNDNKNTIIVYGWYIKNDTRIKTIDGTLDVKVVYKDNDEHKTFNLFDNPKYKQKIEIILKPAVIKAIKYNERIYYKSKTKKEKLWLMT